MPLLECFVVYEMQALAKLPLLLPIDQHLH